MNREIILVISLLSLLVLSGCISDIELANEELVEDSNEILEEYCSININRDTDRCKNYLKTEEEERRVQLNALSSLDLSYCEELSTTKEELTCKKEVIIKSNNPDNCKHLSKDYAGIKFRDLCYLEIAKVKVNQDICEKITTDSIKEGCLYYIMEWQQYEELDQKYNFSFDIHNPSIRTQFTKYNFSTKITLNDKDEPVSYFISMNKLNSMGYWDKYAEGFAIIACVYDEGTKEPLYNRWIGYTSSDSYGASGVLIPLRDDLFGKNLMVGTTYTFGLPRGFLFVDVAHKFEENCYEFMTNLNKEMEPVTIIRHLTFPTEEEI